MTWNYRVCKETHDGEVYYTLREVYYKDNGKIDGMTMKEVGAMGESVEELKEVLQNMLKALNKDVVDVDQLFPTLVSDSDILPPS